MLEKRFMFQMLAFSILWRFEVCEPRQLLMLLLSLFQSFFLLSNPLTDCCTHCVCVCARTTANYKPNEMITMYSMRHFCNTSFKFLIVLINCSRIKACLHIQRDIGKIMLIIIRIVVDVLFS